MVLIPAAGYNLLQYEIHKRQRDMSTGRAMWDSGKAQWVEQCGIVGKLSG